MDISNMLNHTGTSSPILLTHTPILSTHFLLIFQNIPFPFSKHSHHFKEIMLAKQGSIIATKGGYPTMFLQHNNMQLIKWV
jgi:hypothetical protein